MLPQSRLDHPGMASKFDIPSLRNATIAFLLPSAAGKPVEGMRIAEEMNIPELYKEASRYTLDNYANWDSEELAMLSQSTLLKLERRSVSLPRTPGLMIRKLTSQVFITVQALLVSRTAAEAGSHSNLKGLRVRSLVPGSGPLLQTRR